MRRRWQNSRKPHLRKAIEHFMGHQATAGAQQLFARILTCLYFTFVFSVKVYQGMKHAMMMFETVVGHSFKCVSEQSIQLSTHLQLKTVNVQLRAFDFEDDHFGNGELCHKHTLLRKCTGVVLSYFCLKLSKEQESLEHPGTV